MIKIIISCRFVTFSMFMLIGNLVLVLLRIYQPVDPKNRCQKLFRVNL